jgi:hypothetical protein
LFKILTTNIRLQWLSALPGGYCRAHKFDGDIFGNKKEMNMAKMNCWEFNKCGREPGGDNVSEYGICPAARDTSLDGMNQGKSGGRACWAISGTLCEGKVQGTFAVKLSDCKQCSFSS